MTMPSSFRDRDQAKFKEHNDQTTVRIFDESSAKSAFGEMVVVENRPVIRGSATYGFLPANFRSFSALDGFAGVIDRQFLVNSGSSIGSFGAIQSFRTILYKEGDGAIVRFSARFYDNISLTEKGAGAISIGDEMSVGFNGDQFGVWHRYNGEPEVRTLTITASGAGTAILTINGIVYNVPLTAGTIQHNAYEIAEYFRVNPTAALGVDQNNDTVVFSSTSDGPKNGVYSLAGPATGSFSRSNEGVTKTSNFIPQDQFNGEVFDGFNPEFGNTYQIRYQNGFGDIDFMIENPKSGTFQLIHRIKWGNTNTFPNLANPSLRVGAYSFSVGATSPSYVQASYLSASIESKDTPTRNPRSFANTKSIATTPTNIFTIRNRRIYNNNINQSELLPLFISLANDGAKSAIFRIRTNALVGGDKNFLDIGTNLISEYDITGTDVSGGNILATFVVAKGQSADIDLSNFFIQVPATLALTVSAQMASGAAADLSASLTWLEDI